MVDDERDLVELFGDAIKCSGYTVEIYTNAIFASEVIGSQHGNYALIISDIRMPGLSGIELADYISGVDPQISILLMTAFDSIEQNRFECIQKPIRISELIELVIKYVGIRNTSIHSGDSLSQVNP